MQYARILLLVLIWAKWSYGGTNAPITLETKNFRYTISSEGKNLGFVDRSSGIDYLRHDGESPCAMIRRNGKEYPATAVSITDNRMELWFGERQDRVELKLEPQGDWLRMTVTSIEGSPCQSLVFLNVPLTLKASPAETFGACAFSLNLMTRVDQLPALQSELRASAETKFGIVGAKVALVGEPMSQMLPTLKKVLSSADEMPLCKVAGPWASEIPFNHGSYLFNFGSLTETNVNDWIEMVRSLGFSQIDNHGGSAAFFRFGDFELNKEKWPGGWDTYRQIVARLHGANIGSIFHTYAFFIDKHSKYVTPIPDERLDAFRSFTLTEDVTADSEAFNVQESTAGIRTVTGFFEHNSVVLHLDNELVTFSGVSQEPPWRFTGVKRGALGTKSETHKKGSRARHLKECFGLFVPDVKSSLFEEIAANHAEVVNHCDFDGIYLDAIDGSSILRGADECWYWADKFVFEIQKRLKRPVGMEMSSMWHHFWQYRTRWQAWDFPQRGQKRFVDLHAEAVNGGLLLPLHLGWWNFQSFNPPQIEPSYPDVMEYLGARLVGWDAGVSLTGGVDREQLRKVPLFRRAVETLRACEEIRRTGILDEVTKAKLREPGSEFSLMTDPEGKRRFRPSHSEAHTIAMAEPWSLSWSVTNPFPPQAIQVRIEALMSADFGQTNQGRIVGDLRELPKLWSKSTAQGVLASCSTGSSADGFPGCFLAVTNISQKDRHAAWVRLCKEFTPTLDLKERQALGVWLEGDGSGELIGFRLESPTHLAFGAVADRYIPVDFVGRRFFTLVETESTKWNDYVWNDQKSLYNLYRETIDFSKVESLEIWCQNLPLDKPVRCGIGSVEALPMVKSTIKDPVLTINGTMMVLPLELVSGSWVELNGTRDCFIYGPQGESLAQITIPGNPPLIDVGANSLQFTCTSTNRLSPRAKITLFTHGSPLK